MELKDTVDFMCSEDYKKRFIGEYLQTKIRYEKLKYMVETWDKGELKFTPTCSRGLYNVQLKAMRDYLSILELRALKEKIDLPKFEGVNVKKNDAEEKKEEKKEKDDKDVLAEMLFDLFILSMLS